MLQALLVALLVGFAIQSMGRAGEPLLRGVGYLQKLVFRILAMVMWLAPIGAFGAIAAVVGETGIDALKSLAVIMLALLRHLRDLRVRHPRAILKVVAGVNVFRAAEVPGPRVPAHRLDVVVRDRAPPADRQDGARRRQPARRRDRRADRLLLQPRRHRHLPDDGLAVHRRGAGRSAVASASRSGCSPS